MTHISKSDSYAAAGVDVTAGYKSVELIKEHVKSTYTPGVVGDIGGFGALFAPDMSKYKNPVFVSGTDGVGTKLKLAFLLDRHDTIGIDCVAMCVNDVACAGAEPLFFLDYIAVGRNFPEKIEQIVSGIAKGCRQAGCALIGGETAEHPGLMPEHEYDLAGFCVGVADKSRLLTGAGIKEGDVLIGIASSGVHSNGFSLVRKVFDIDNNPAVLGEFASELGCTLGEELLKPTRIYVGAVRALQAAVKVKAISHITGGGLIENLPRVLPEGITAAMTPHSYPVPPIFGLIARQGDIPARDMANTFNMGLGMIAVVDAKDAGAAVLALSAAGEKSYVVGVCRAGDTGIELW